MNESIMAHIARAMTDSETVERYSDEAQGTMAHELEKAWCSYHKWLSTLTDIDANNDAFLATTTITSAERLQGYAEGFKAGIKLMIETLM